ncbi:MAG: pyruvate formate lyase-activating protein [Chloroflexi bacterium]|nr:MAG: pyruvate formate lyase-activating protein [Chloroflexota bacterium]
MKILTVDIGTGTQDIFLYDSHLDIENGFKLVLPSPTMMIHQRVRQALAARTPLLLTGHQMGGGPSAWAIEAAARAGIPIYMTPSAATTLNDELEKVEALGIKIVSEEESKKLALSDVEGLKVKRLELKDFDFELISKTFEDYGVSLNDLEAIAVAVFDHGNAPAGVSDRQFRFDYLDERIRAKNSLSAFAYLAKDIPRIMTRLQSVADSAGELPCPLIVMDTAPAAVLGADLDPVVATRKQKIICNVGNFHTLAFRLGEKGIEGVFEHHTGEIDLSKLELLLRALAEGTLKHEDVFNDMGHGALLYSQEKFEFRKDDFDVVVTGPRRSMFNRQSSIVNRKSLRPYFATPYGDMMIAGCFGLLAATAEVMPDLTETIHGSLRGERGRGVAPWDN